MTVDRRTFMSLVASAAAVPRNTWAQAGSKKVALYAAVGAVLTQYDVDVEGLTLTSRGSVTLIFLRLCSLAPLTVMYSMDI